MKIGDLREHIKIQKSTLTKDKNGNQVLKWEDYYTCASYVNNLSGKEYWEAAQVNAENEIFFIIRYSSEVKAMDTEHYRIEFRGQLYNITFIDNVQYRNRTLKLRASLVKR
jgi:SPP1 family predicted phage head-tail adaptor